MLAAKGGHLEVVQLLLQAGADKEKQNTVSVYSSIVSYSQRLMSCANF